MSSNEDQSAEVKETEEVEVGERPAVDGVNEAVGGGGDGSAGGGGDGPVRYTDTEVREMSPGRRLEVVAQGALSVPQMRAFLGISSETAKELLQSLLLKTAEAEASAAEAAAAVDAKVAAEAALAVATAAAAAATVAVEEARAAATVAVEEARAEASAAVAGAFNAAGGDLGSPGTSELGTGSAAAIESMLRARLQGPGYSDARVIATLVARLPTDQGIAYVQSLLRDPEESLPEETVAAALFQAFGMSAEAAVARLTKSLSFVSL